ISDASRLDAELARQDAEPVDIALLLQTVVGIASETTLSDGPTTRLVAADGGKDAYLVVGHDSRLGQVFNNLIDNARSFCRPDGEVWVTLRRVGSAVEVVVDDDGPGIREGQAERIFERFYTDRPEQEAFGQNSGLGLSIPKQIVEAHHGRIWAENRTPPVAGDGTEIVGARFVVRL